MDARPDLGKHQRLHAGSGIGLVYWRSFPIILKQAQVLIPFSVRKPGGQNSSFLERAKSALLKQVASTRSDSAFLTIHTAWAATARSPERVSFALHASFAMPSIIRGSTIGQRSWQKRSTTSGNMKQSITTRSSCQADAVPNFGEYYQLNTRRITPSELRDGNRNVRSYSSVARTPY